LVEFALASTVLVLLFGGLVDLTRATHFADVLQGAAREGARAGAAYSAGSASNPNLNDTAIKLIVDAQLKAGGLPASVLKNPAVNCPGVADGNSVHNPPYASGAFPAAANSPWLYICYDNNPALDYPTVPPTDKMGHDLNVILVMAYGPVTGVVPTSLGGNLGLGTGLHARVQGG
jgi:hypothetical protein